MVSSKGTKTESTAEAVPAIDWSKVSSLEEARALLGDIFLASDVLGDGADFIEDKSRLVGEPFIILEWRFITDEASKREYVNVHVMFPNAKRARFNDGSTGVYAQLKKVSHEIGMIPIRVDRGLRRSDYVKEGVGDATTYYLASS